MQAHRQKERDAPRFAAMSLHYWELISDKLRREGFSTGHVRFFDPQERLLWGADASRDGKRWVVHAENPGKPASS